MLTSDDCTLAVKVARKVIESYVGSKKIENFDLPEAFMTKLGVFVTINTYPEKKLRGCIGYPEPLYPFKDALVDSAKSATRDPRFPPLKQNELDKIVIEVSILTKPELIIVKNPKEYLTKIKIGVDGLIAERGIYRGLLLPQVATEYNWDVEEFLCHTCMKAGLMADAWTEKDTKIFKFTAKIFDEVEPNGKVIERTI
ncbi:MAG: TIGR00296 family protein [Candidatus Thermoplasmatota archaeon]